METAIYLVVVAAVAFLGMLIAGSRRYRAQVLRLAATLHAGAPTRDVEAALPAVVADFARRNGADPQRPQRVASFNQAAQLRLKPGGPFRRFAAWQVISLGRAGFLWDAQQTSGPIPRVRVLDAYVGTEGRLEARLLGFLTVAQEAGPDISLGEAYRYLAELPWAPDAILGNPDLAWRVTGPDTVEVRLTTPEGIARVSFGFDAGGDIVAVEARQRPARDPNGGTVRYDWRGRFGDYTWIGGRRVPARAEVGYVYPTGYEVYFRGTVSDYRLAA